MRVLLLLEKEDKRMRYYVNKNAQTNGDHEIHRPTCSWLPDAENRLYLGDFATSQEALKEARRYYNQVNGCYYCCPEIHTS